MALILENVGKTFEYTGRATLKNINLEIQPGEFLCVVGKSGCGKSTLLNLIAGLEAPTEGRILLNGKEVKGPGSERTVMFQEHALFPWLNVIQNIKFGMKINGVPKEEQEIRAEKYLKMMQLEQYKDYAIVNLYKVYLANMRGFFELENGDNEMRQLACDMKKLLKSKTPAYFAQYASKKEVLELKLVKLGLPFYKAYIKSKGFAANLLKR